jgi:archaeal flagellin FlaB
MVITRSDPMPEPKYSQDAFTGLEAAIVLIAFVVVAAVFSYVVLGAGFYTSQKSQETVYKSVEQATSNIQMVGNVYGISTTSDQINEIEFSIGLTPGAPAADLTKMTIMYSSDTVAPIIYGHGGATADATHFSAKISGTNTAVSAMEQNDQVTIRIILSPAAVLTKNQKYNLEIRPIKGAAYAFSRTTGPNIFKTNVL